MAGKEKVFMTQSTMKELREFLKKDEDKLEKKLDKLQKDIISDIRTLLAR